MCTWHSKVLYRGGWWWFGYLSVGVTGLGCYRGDAGSHWKNLDQRSGYQLQAARSEKGSIQAACGTFRDGRKMSAFLSSCRPRRASAV